MHHRTLKLSNEIRYNITNSNTKRTAINKVSKLNLLNGNKIGVNNATRIVNNYCSHCVRGVPLK